MSCTPHRPSIPGDPAVGLDDRPPASDRPGRPFSSGGSTRAYHYRHCLGWPTSEVKSELVGDGFGALFPADLRPAEVTAKVHKLVAEGKLAVRRSGYCPHPGIDLRELAQRFRARLPTPPAGANFS